MFPKLTISTDDFQVKPNSITFKENFAILNKIQPDTEIIKCGGKLNNTK